ncbi:hypothetical protein PGT21_016431 [Puccinia graminis f. sp. tritici]|uniref:Uncharacterized protein n=1 Tax=Puccinia graminis f. sp. tritici TaxID=56615 RepID=A0A5B0LQS9_PUCGR|nr:hypothetical protein PGT21_016431 [Puccinia graminis f. sp. tritici]KAA1130518.1 hypothetical protein PGTUg99_014789 [Puccinia graminis f. sp. tritici]
MCLIGFSILWPLVSLPMILAAHPADELGMHKNSECTGQVHLFSKEQPCENNCNRYIKIIGRVCSGCDEQHYELAQTCDKCCCPVLDSSWHNPGCKKPYGVITTAQERLPPCNNCKDPFWTQRRKMICLTCRAINRKMTSWQSLCDTCTT